MRSWLSVLCVVLAAALVLCSVVLLVRSRRHDNSVESIAAVVSMIVAGIPAAVYGAISA